MKIEKIIRSHLYGSELRQDLATEFRRKKLGINCGNVFLQERTWNRQENAPQLACSSLQFSIKFCINVHEKASAFHPELYVA